MKSIPYKGYFIKPSNNFLIDDCCVSAFPGSTGIFSFKSVRAAKCYITKHLTPKAELTLAERRYQALQSNQIA